MKIQPYKSNGVTISPTILKNNDDLTITYNGLLAQSGADNVYLHIGCGECFENKRDVKMEKVSPNKFEATVKVNSPEQSINFCFRDSMENWDNNNGVNYVLDSHVM